MPTSVGSSTANLRLNTSARKREECILSICIWIIIDVVFLGFRQKLENRLRRYINLTDECDDNEEYKAKILEWRTGQQEEWDRLAMTTSLLATVSAASLAFAGIDNSWWVARASFAGSVGLSICGYLAVSHLSILCEGAEDNKMTLAARGELFGSLRQVACVMATPIVLSGYAAGLILFGHTAFILTIHTDDDNKPTAMSRFRTTLSEPGFKVFAGVPIIFGVFMLGTSVIFAEMMYRKAHGRRAHECGVKPIQT
ncbi:hypothetical protein BDQ12DRAFT_722548 [Crucibulum laeve]|uniref:Transmembrane protein n=1 Tax=Crucibulum laeve TaxID=68775 RepID=A0A5C3M2W1_9AGAR|nr:hypothetical protein BDQ12DRAFT_722548 [Crucibulum laeve]